MKFLLPHIPTPGFLAKNLLYKCWENGEGAVEGVLTDWTMVFTMALFNMKKIYWKTEEQSCVIGKKKHIREAVCSTGGGERKRSYRIMKENQRKTKNDVEKHHGTDKQIHWRDFHRCKGRIRKYHDQTRYLANLCVTFGHGNICP